MIRAPSFSRSSSACGRCDSAPFSFDAPARTGPMAASMRFKPALRAFSLPGHCRGSGCFSPFARRLLPSPKRCHRAGASWTRPVSRSGSSASPSRSSRIGRRARSVAIIRDDTSIQGSGRGRVTPITSARSFYGSASRSWHLPRFTAGNGSRLVSPLFVMLLLTRISGIPLLEKRADERWGDHEAYQAYKARTPVLIPRPPCAEHRGSSRAH